MNTQAILGWVKSHVVIVVCAVLILAAIPLGWVFSNQWAQQILAERKKEFDAQKQELSRAETVTYTVPPILPSEQAVELSWAPNPTLTKHFQEARARRASQAEAVVEAAVQFNRGERGLQPLLPGIFPAPEATGPSAERLASINMARAVLGNPQRGQAPAYEALLTRLGAGSPPAPEELQSDLARLAEIERGRAEAGAGEQGEGVEEAVKAAVREQRISMYAQRAEELSFYASPQDITAGLTVPQSDAPTSLREAFAWQADLWLAEMVLEAAARTNAQAAALGIPGAPIKRVLGLSAPKLNLGTGTTGGDSGMGGGMMGGGVMGGRSGYGGDFGGGAEYGGGYGGDFGGGYGGEPAYGSGGTDAGTAAPKSSFTGRDPSTPEDPYTVRPVRLSIIASSKDLPRVVASLGRSNFITVVDVSLSQVPVWEHLSNGYFYGDEHVVQADLTLETVWLDALLAEFAPASVREALGLPELATPETAEPGMEPMDQGIPPGGY